MKCPFCSADDTRVIDSRPAEENSSIRRRRQCDACNRRFTTYERLDAIPLLVIKKNQTRESYDRSKIERGLLRSCTKLPISVDEMTEIVNSIEVKIFSLDTKEITTQQIGEIVLDKLASVNSVAYIRFASIYREFTDVESFFEEIQKLQEKK